MLVDGSALPVANQRVLRLVVVAVVMAGCYSPELSPCTLRCAPGSLDACPPGDVCLDDKFCHGSASEPACPCLPLHCEELTTCGTALDDGCSGTIDCACDPGECVPEQCAANTCGALETCGMTIHCATCNSPATCGGNGALDQCGTCQISPFMPGFPAMNCGTANPYYCSNINACLHDEVNCLTRKVCAGIPDDLFCPCGEVVDCATGNCVPGST